MCIRDSFHLAAVVSGEAEADFDKGYAVNLDGSRNLFEAIRAQGRGYCPVSYTHLDVYKRQLYHRCAPP